MKSDKVSLKEIKNLKFCEWCVDIVVVQDIQSAPVQPQALKKGAKSLQVTQKTLFKKKGLQQKG